MLAVASAALAAAPSPAPVATGTGTPYYDGMPPARFQGEVVEVVVYTNDVTPYCGTAPEGLEIIACTRDVKGTPVTVLPNPCAIGDEDWYARIACHEKGHALGWPGDHPQ
jgi:hypothetical protein